MKIIVSILIAFIVISLLTINVGDSSVEGKNTSNGSTSKVVENLEEKS